VCALLPVWFRAVVWNCSCSSHLHNNTVSRRFRLGLSSRFGWGQAEGEGVEEGLLVRAGTLACCLLISRRRFMGLLLRQCASLYKSVNSATASIWFLRKRWEVWHACTLTFDASPAGAHCLESWTRWKGVPLGRFRSPVSQGPLVIHCHESKVNHLLHFSQSSAPFRQEPGSQLAL
jgi:hypothetical protein